MKTLLELTKAQLKEIIREEIYLIENNSNFAIDAKNTIQSIKISSLLKKQFPNVKYEKTSTFFDFSGYIDKSVADKIYKALKGSGIKFNVDGI
jgi:hypothetical protein